MNLIQQTLINTPWWVYVLLIYLIKLGIEASRTRVIQLKKLFIVPAIFMVMSIHTLLTSFPINVINVMTWVFSILLGSFLGWLQIYRYHLKIDREKSLIQIPGTWSTLIIILIIFTTKYYFGYELAIDPNLATQTTFEVSALLISGMCTGLFVGRLICYVYRFSTEPTLSL